MWCNRGDTALWQVIRDFVLCAQNKPHLSPRNLKIGQEVLSEPSLSPQHRQGWFTNKMKAKVKPWQPTRNAKSLGEVATQTQPNHKE